MQSNILEIHKNIIEGKKAISKIITESKELNKKFKHTNSTINTIYDYVLSNIKDYENNVANNTDNLLFGIPYSLKDNIMTKGLITTGGSKMLKDYIPPFNSTVYELLSNTKSILVSKSNLDEYGLGGTGTYSGFGVVKNIIDEEYTTGGSSSGSVNLVNAEIVPFAIGTDTGDSIRRPASFCNVVGYKPTYGLISRYGVIPYAPSFDTVGIVTKYVCDAAIVAQEIIKFDEKDYTSTKIDDSNFYKNLKTIDDIKFVCIKGLDEYLNNDAKELYLKAIKSIEEKYTIKYIDVNWKILQGIEPTYMSLTYSEATSCHADKQGLIYGTTTNDKYPNLLNINRTNGFGDQLKERFTLGAYFTSSENFDEIYQGSKKIRTLIIDEFDKMIGDDEVLILPGSSSTAPKINDILAQVFSTTLADDLLQLANFSGAPSITIPFKKTTMPWGINLTAKKFKDQLLLNSALSLEELFLLKNID